MSRSNHDTSRRVSTALRSARRWLIGCAAGSLLAGVGAADPVVYHSVNDDGQRPLAPPTISQGVPTTLNLWIADDKEAPDPSGVGTACKSGAGDERCGWDITIEPEASVGSISLGNLTETPQGTVVGPANPARRRFNGGDYTSGVLEPRKLGELEVSSSIDAEGAIVIRELRVVNAALELTTPIPQPGGTVIATVPEPELALSLFFGSGWLALLRSRRDRSRSRR